MDLPSSLLVMSFFVLCATLNSSVLTRTEAQETGISSLVSEELFNKVFPNMNNIACPAKGFYSYEAFINAAKRFPAFGTTGSYKARKRDIAAFFAQISHQSASGSRNSTGPYTWGLCLKEQADNEFGGDHCDYSFDYRWDCNPFRDYNGRGPMMIKWNFNYGPVGMDLGLGYELQWYPERLLSSSKLAFETALWVWMTARSTYPSPHDIMVGNYKPTIADLAANWTAGYGFTTNVMGMSTHDYECGKLDNGRVRNRIKYFKRIAGLFKVSTGPYLRCADQKLVTIVPFQYPPAPPPPQG